MSSSQSFDNTSNPSSGNPSSVDPAELKYCTLCDKYFKSKDYLLKHVQRSDNHPRCDTCNRGFLNKNSLRKHFAFSSNHIYCSVCDKNFKSVAALNVHLEHSIRHSDDSDDDDEDAVDNRPDGWEEELAEKLDREERARQIEEHFTVDSADEGRLSNVQRRAAMLNFMARRKRGNAAPEVRSYCCPVCLSYPKNVAATRCGHLFCMPCISRAIETKGECPTCRKENVNAHIRKVNMSVY